MLLYSFQGLFFFLTCSTSCHRPRRRTLSSGCTVTGSHLTQGSSPASQVKITARFDPRNSCTLGLARSQGKKKEFPEYFWAERKQSRFSAVVAGGDLLRMSREDLIQICGPADGIRLFNTMKGRWGNKTHLGVLSHVRTRKWNVFRFVFVLGKYSRRW